VEVLVLVDNKTDSLSSIPKSSHSQGFKNEIQTLRGQGMQELKGCSQCCALHGLSLLVTATFEGKRRTVLFDAGPVDFGMSYNGERLGAKFSEVDAVMLSHGHWDHAGGLTKALDLIVTAKGASGVPCYLHPGMFRQRGITLPDSTVLPVEKVPSPEELRKHGASPIVTSEAKLLLDNSFYVSSEIERITEYEKGFPGHVRRSADNNSWEPDPFIMDERYLAVLVKNKGLVVFSACSHAGIINVMESATKELGQKIHAVIGGFHLSGAANEAIIGRTVSGFKKFQPDLILPGHCTGWRAVQALCKEFGERVVPTAVGMTLRF